MRSEQDRIESKKRNERLNWAIRQAGYAGRQLPIAEGVGLSVNTVKGHIDGRNDFGTAIGRAYADFLNVSLAWLYLGLGKPDDAGPPVVDAKIRDVSARLAAVPVEVRDNILSYAEFSLDRYEKSRETATSPTS